MTMKVFKMDKLMKKEWNGSRNEAEDTLKLKGQVETGKPTKLV